MWKEFVGQLDPVEIVSLETGSTSLGVIGVGPQILVS
jgi:hypothetical protein